MTAAMAFIVSFYIHRKILIHLSACLWIGNDRWHGSKYNTDFVFWLTQPRRVQHQEDAEWKSTIYVLRVYQKPLLRLYWLFWSRLFCWWILTFPHLSLPLYFYHLQPFLLKVPNFIHSSILVKLVSQFGILKYSTGLKYDPQLAIGFQWKAAKVCSHFH